MEGCGSTLRWSKREGRELALQSDSFSTVQIQRCTRRIRQTPRTHGAQGKASGLAATSKSVCPPAPNPTATLTEAHKLISSASGPELWEIPTAAERSSQAETCMCSAVAASAVSWP